MEPVFPFVLLGLAIGLFIWGVNNLAVDGTYTKLSPPVPRLSAWGCWAGFSRRMGKVVYCTQFSRYFFSSGCYSGVFSTPLWGGGLPESLL